MVAATSTAAFRSIDLTDLEGKVLTVIDAAGVVGCISDEVLACYPTLSYSSITARFCSLEKKKEIYRAGDTRPGVSGRQQQVMRLGRYIGSVPVVKPVKTPKKSRTGFLAGMMHAARTILMETDLIEAKKALKRELLKAAKR